MMTIKEFAQLCSCNAQTLRYYDKIGLLKPVKVDPWSGYRYYDKSQAIDFVKIKNLQAADFSIGEIKVLLTKTDAQVYEAFDQKITEQEQKLTRIKEIQQSYLAEKTNMEQTIQNIIENLTDFLLKQANHYDILKEFGLKPEDWEQIIDFVRTYMETELAKSIPDSREITLMLDDKVYRGPEQVSEAVSDLNGILLPDTLLLGNEHLLESDKHADPTDYDTVWEIHGWDHVYDFIDRIPTLEDGQDYCFEFRLNEELYTEDISFPVFMLGAMILRKGDAKIIMGCCVERSSDSENHFTLLRKK